MIFNVLIKNMDDHAKNFSFILINKTWQLSPAYDLLPGGGFNGFHTTTVHGQGSPTRKDIMEVANQAGLNKRRANDIFEEIYQKTNNLI
jgi:serine/threonine-protein kinase HipA